MILNCLMCVNVDKLCVSVKMLSDTNQYYNYRRRSVILNESKSLSEALGRSNNDEPVGLSRRVQRCILKARFPKIQMSSGSGSNAGTSSKKVLRMCKAALDPTYSSHASELNYKVV